MAFTVTDKRRKSAEPTKQPSINSDIIWVNTESLVIRPALKTQSAIITLNDKLLNRLNYGTVIHSASPQYPEGINLMYPDSVLTRKDMAYGDDGDILLNIVDIVAILPRKDENVK